MKSGTSQQAPRRNEVRSGEESSRHEDGPTHSNGSEQRITWLLTPPGRKQRAEWLSDGVAEGLQQHSPPSQRTDRVIVRPRATIGQGTEAYNVALTCQEGGERDLLSARNDKSWYRLQLSGLDADMYEKAAAGWQC